MTGEAQVAALLDRRRLGEFASSVTPDGSWPAGGFAARRGTRAGATRAPLRGGACSLSSETLRRSA